MSEEDRREFLVCYESKKSVPFDNKHVLETYSHSGNTVLKQAYLVFRLKFVHIGNINVFV